MLESSKKTYLLIGVLVVVFIGLGSATFYFYKKSRIIPQQTSQSNQTELDKVLNEIGKIALLPTTDSPTLFSVSDPTQLTSDSFFEGSEAGDEMLLYPHIGFAILYRPSTKQVINMMHFNPASTTERSLEDSASNTSIKK